MRGVSFSTATRRAGHSVFSAREGRENKKKEAARQNMGKRQTEPPTHASRTEETRPTRTSNGPETECASEGDRLALMRQTRDPKGASSKRNYARAGQPARASRAWPAVSHSFFLFSG